ncbi:hypothetical protein [Streptomyces sp. NPDC005828]|uniref:hypothetical protein n=1 Tax=Streptomyces sp. NPDC005828 TaxID=3157071 RepID=UPI0033C4C39C
MPQTQTDRRINVQTILVTGASGAVGRQVVAYEVFLNAAFAGNPGPASRSRPRIGDRARPLAEKTMARTRSGLEKYGTALVPVEGGDRKQPFGVDRPMRTCTGRNETGLPSQAGRQEGRG